MSTYVLCPLSTFMQVMAGATAGTGVALNAGLIWTYAAGTSTPTTTWTDSTGSVPNSNPIQLNTFGQLANVNIWQKAGTPIKIQFSTNSGTVGSPAFGVQVGPTFDNVVGVGDTVFGQNTYYGGTDSGSVNAYVLNFSATFTSYINGIIIYWVPNNTNTGASTLNVNGLGAIAIQNVDGSALLPNQLVANQVATVALQGGVFFLVASGNTPANFSGTFTANLTGMTGSTTGTMNYVRNGALVTLRCSAANIQGTSNTPSMTMTGFPSTILPTVSTRGFCSDVTDNGNTNVAALLLCSSGGVFTFYLGKVSGSYLQWNTSGFTSSGTKGITQGWTASYLVN